MTLKKKVLVALAAIGLSAGAVTVAVAPANAAGTCAAGHYCAWNSTGYNSPQIVDSATTANTTVSVGSNYIRSWQNHQTRRWCSVTTNGVVSTITGYFAGNTNVSSAGSSVNFFWPGGTGRC